MRTIVAKRQGILRLEDPIAIRIKIHSCIEKCPFRLALQIHNNLFSVPPSALGASTYGLHQWVFSPLDTAGFSQWEAPTRRGSGEGEWGQVIYSSDGLPFCGVILNLLHPFPSLLSRPSFLSTLCLDLLKVTAPSSCSFASGLVTRLLCTR